MENYIFDFILEYTGTFQGLNSVYLLYFSDVTLCMWENGRGLNSFYVALKKRVCVIEDVDFLDLSVPIPDADTLSFVNNLSPASLLVLSSQIVTCKL